MNEKLIYREHRRFLRYVLLLVWDFATKAKAPILIIHILYVLFGKTQKATQKVRVSKPTVPRQTPPILFVVQRYAYF